MKETFLCSKCLNWLKNNPNEIPEACHKAYLSSVKHYQDGDLHRAFKAVGSAFEMAELMFFSDKIIKTFAIDGLAVITELYVRVLSEMGRWRDSFYIQEKSALMLNDIETQKELKRVMPKLAKMNSLMSHDKNYLSVIH